VEFPYVILGALSFGVVKSVNFVILYWYKSYLDLIGAGEHASLITTTNEIGKAIGGIALGYVSDKLNSR
jgi:sugar phosphate permease